MIELPRYFCFGAWYCIRKATKGCQICFRGMCDKHTYHEMPGDFYLCMRCRHDMQRGKNLMDLN